MKYLKVKNKHDDNCVSYYDIESIHYFEIRSLEEIISYQGNNCVISIHFKDGRIKNYDKNWLIIFE